MGMGWAPRLERAYDRQKQADIPGGRLPHFSLTLPKVVELDEGDKLHLDCTIEGWPRPMCKLQLQDFCLFYTCILQNRGLDETLVMVHNHTNPFSKIAVMEYTQKNAHWGKQVPNWTSCQ